MMNPQQSIILFDGVCNLCNASVDFIIQRDKRAHFKFSSLQAPIASELLRQYPSVKDSSLDSVLLLHKGKLYDKSAAALRIARHLSGLWPMLYVFIIVPPFIRDAVYRFIARNRYKWFGKSDTCRLPSPEERERFLE
jgi:predicted DCC family thiol-disulfide oxidoreductase YuxK